MRDHFIPKKKNFVPVILGCLGLILVTGNVNAENEIKSGTTLVVAAGKTIVEDGSSTIQSGGTMTNLGTVVIKGNLVNANGTTLNLGTGLFEFSGSAAQTITGPNEFGTLRIANTGGGVTVVSGDQKVNTALKLKNGLLTLGANNLLLAAAATDSGGSATSMVVATGTGELRKEFPGTGSFIYPVGDNTGTAEYSPVTVNFTSGTFNPGNYLGVRLKNQPDPSPQIATGDYLNRYWEFSSNNISGTIACNLTVSFLDADVSGVKANLYLLKTDPNLETFNKYSGSNQLTGTVSGFSRFTGARAALEANFTVFLEGPYDPSSGLMNNYLNEFFQIIPTTASDPAVYGDFPWYYPGNESFSYSTLPLNVIDWVLVELCQATLPENVSGYFTRKAGLLTSNGQILDPSNFGPMKFYNSAVTTGNNLYCVVRHRNHLAVMSNFPVTKTGSIYNYDFSTDGTKSFPGTPGFGTKLISGKWACRAGDAEAEGSVQPSSLYIYLSSANQDGYKKADFNFDSSVQPDDLYLYLLNANTDSQVPYFAY